MTVYVDDFDTKHLVCEGSLYRWKCTRCGVVVDMEPNILGTPLKVMEAAIKAFRESHKDCK